MTLSITAPQDDDLDPLVVEAADWLVRMTSGEATADDASALAEWRERSPQHDAVFRELAGLRVAAKSMRARGAGHSRRAFLLGGAFVVVGGAYATARPPFDLWPSFAELTADHRTGAGERYGFGPVAGVHVEMNSRTSISIANQGRGVTLIRGEAFVSVSNPAQPFTVDAGRGRIEATSARFNIRALAGELNVTCVEGALTCRQNGAQAALRAGETLAVAGGRVERTKADPAAATAWLQGLLVFDGAPLSEVVEQINLYRPGRIILANPAVGLRPVVGVFHTNQIENAVAQIQQLLGLSLRRLPGGVVIIG